MTARLLWRAAVPRDAFSRRVLAALVVGTLLAGLLGNVLQRFGVALAPSVCVSAGAFLALYGAVYVVAARHDARELRAAYAAARLHRENRAGGAVAR